MKALVLAPFSQDALEALQELASVDYQSWRDSHRLCSPEEMACRLGVNDIGALFIEADFAFEEVFQRSPCLRFLGVCRSTLNHVDLEAATDHGVVVAYAPSRNARAVAELTLGLMIALARRIPQTNDYVRQGRWQDPVEPYIAMGGLELGGKTLGIIGMGVIGKAVARLGKALAMRVVGHDPFVYTGGTQRDRVPLMGLEELLHEADFVSVHTSSTPGVEGMLDMERLSLMKPGAYLINTANYQVIEEVALVKLLRSGHLAGAALDVHVSHPIPTSSPLLALDNVILTPHIGGATEETVERHSWMMVDELRRFLKGRKPVHLANPEVWRRRA